MAFGLLLASKLRTSNIPQPFILSLKIKRIKQLELFFFPLFLCCFEMYSLISIFFRIISLLSIELNHSHAIRPNENVLAVDLKENVFNKLTLTLFE